MGMTPQHLYTCDECGKQEAVPVQAYDPQRGPVGWFSITSCDWLWSVMVCSDTCLIAIATAKRADA